jgi:teichuronic acid biosynthesis glycosyltransferase TuaH
VGVTGGAAARRVADPLGGRLSGTRADLIVYLATTRYDGQAGTDRHMADQLSRQGPVLFVDPPVSAVSRARRPELAGTARGPAPRIQHDRLAVITPLLTPGFTRAGIHLLAPPMMRRAVRNAARWLFPAEDPSIPVRGIVSCRIDDVWAALPSRRRVYFATDDLAAGADLLGVPPARLRRHEASTLRGADAVAVVSEPLRARFAEQGYPAALIPNGCDPEAYQSVDEAARPPDVPLQGPLAGFVGYLNDRIDLALLEAVADSGVHLLLVGERAHRHRGGRFEALVTRPTVCWVGPKPYRELPGYLRLIDVGLTPYADTAFNRASFPLKTLEYLAAGRPVVSTPLPANDWLATDLVQVAAGPAQYADRVRTTLSTERTELAVQERRAFAREHSWARRAEALIELLPEERPSERSR